VTRGKVAFITGIAGQDGALLAALLGGKGYTVHGLVRWDSYPDPLDGLQRLDALGLVSEGVTLHIGDVTDANSMTALIKAIAPDEVYNLAALSQVQVSFSTPSSALTINTQGTLNVLEAVRVLGFGNRVRIYQASSSEMFGSASAPQNEETPFAPCSPYGAAKLAAFWLARTYRDAYGMHVSNGILFNHESSLRSEDFVTRKITRAAAAIEAGHQERLVLGNLDSLRDWGHAHDYVRGMWMMLQQDEPDDYVLATGQARSVRDFAVRAFAQTGAVLEWRGEGASEQGVDARTGKLRITVDPALFRPKDVHHLLGNPTKARRVLGWKPEISFDVLVAEMVNADRQIFRQDRTLWPMAS
jgi:GDPmannose 4,6-dehydratase